MMPHDYDRFRELKVVMHMIYELRKGIRSLVLCTLFPNCAEIVKERLGTQGIEYITQQSGNRNVNIFFGEKPCLDAVSTFVHKRLNELTPRRISCSV